MKLIAFNGSSRKEWNTGTLLQKVLDGAAAQGAETKLVHLYDLDYQGCISCFACKEKDGPSYGRCVVKDDLLPLFKEIELADAVVFGSPIYLGNIAGQMQSFLERLVFPYLPYTDPPSSLFPKKIRAGFIYTMGVPEELMEKVGYRERFAAREQTLARIFGSCETLLCCDTYQFDDYSKVEASRFNAAEKLKRRQEVFPADCRKAYELGQRLV